MSGSIAALFQRLTQGVYVVGVAQSHLSPAWVMQVSFPSCLNPPFLPGLRAGLRHPRAVGVPLLLQSRLVECQVVVRSPGRRPRAGPESDRMELLDSKAEPRPIAKPRHGRRLCAVPHVSAERRGLPRRFLRITSHLGPCQSYVPHRSAAVGFSPIKRSVSELPGAVRRAAGAARRNSNHVISFSLTTSSGCGKTPGLFAYPAIPEHVLYWPRIEHGAHPGAASPAESLHRRCYLGHVETDRHYRERHTRVPLET